MLFQKVVCFMIVSILCLLVDDVKSLSLQGTYHEKITSLGYSLQNFTRLQHLDLSKNNLTTLKVSKKSIINASWCCKILKIVFY